MLAGGLTCSYLAPPEKNSFILSFATILTSVMGHKLGFSDGLTQIVLAAKVKSEQGTKRSGHSPVFGSAFGTF